MIWRLIILGSVMYLSVSCGTKRSWNFELLTASATSSNENLMNVSIQIDRVSFSESAVSGRCDWQFDTDENTTLEMTILHSVSGRDEDYNETPYKIRKHTFKDFVDYYYKDFVYANLGECSNLPTFNGKFVPPWPRGTYIFRSCKLSGDGFPYILPLGYYKMRLHMRGVVEMIIIGTTKLSPKLI